MPQELDYMARGNALMHSMNNNMAKHQEIQKLARMGAEQFAQYGPEGQAWAQRLTANPREALLMAEKMGGFGEIENQLKSQKYESEAAQYMKPDDASLLKAYGPQGMTYIEAARLDRAERLGTGAPEPFKGEDFRAIMGKRSKVSDDFDQLFIAHKMANAADLESPEWGQALTILFNKVLQPNSAVLEGEADATARSMQSLLEEAGVIVGGVFNPRAPLGREARVRIMNMMNKLASVGMKDYKRRHDGWSRANRDYGIEPNSPRDFFTRPGYERLGDVDKALGGASRTIHSPSDAQSAVSPEEIQAAEKAGRIPAANGRFLVRDANGEWDWEE